MGQPRPVLSAEEVPEDNAELASVDVDFARLPDDSAASCPVPISEVLRYLADEVPAALSEADLTFRRTAVVEGTRYWVWSFTEPDGGSAAYVTVSMSPAGATTLGYEDDYYGLSPEQYVLGDYHNVF